MNHASHPSLKLTVRRCRDSSASPPAEGGLAGEQWPAGTDLAALLPVTALGARTRKHLAAAGICTAGDLLASGDAALAAIAGIGAACLNTARQARSRLVCGASGPCPGCGGCECSCSCWVPESWDRYRAAFRTAPAAPGGAR